jgi:hypothetical protein
MNRHNKLSASERLIAQLEAATAPPDAHPQGLEGEARQLRTTWRALDAALSAADDEFESGARCAPVLPPARSSHAAKRREKRFGLLAGCCALSLVVLLTWFVFLFSDAAPVVQSGAPREAPRGKADAVDANGLPAWNDQLDQRIAIAGETVLSLDERRPSHDWSALSLLRRVEAMTDEAAGGSL